MRAVLIVLLVPLSGLLFPALARAQTSIPVRRTLTNDYGPYSVYGRGLTYRQPSFYSGPSSTSVRAQTSVLVPDGGEALVGGLSSVSEGRNEAGTPVLSKAPYLSRGFKNVGYGRRIQNTSVSVRVRVIRMADEEERQTGLRP
jgi:Flp pilus assembly secretin CpaC